MAFCCFTAALEALPQAKPASSCCAVSSRPRRRLQARSLRRKKPGGKVAGRLSLHAQRLGYETIIAPVLPGFLKAHSDVVLDVKIADAPVDIVAEGFDAGIRLGELLAQDVIAVSLDAGMRQVAIASPDYIARYGRPEHPRELMSHRCITFRWPGRDAIYDWEFTDPDTGDDFAVPVTGPLVLSEQRAGVEAAIAGVGIAFWVESAIRPMIEAGTLEILLDRWSQPFPGFSIFYPSRRSGPTLRALIDYLRSSQTIVT